MTPASEAPTRWPKSQRLRKREDFQRLRTEGDSTAGRLFRVSILAGSSDQGSRFGIITTRRMGNATVRARLRRRFRELLRLHQSEILHPVDLVIIPKTASATVSWDELVSEWHRLASRLGLLHNKPSE